MGSREAWDRIGAPRELLRELRYDVDAAMELRIQACAVREPRFWRVYGDLLQPEFFQLDSASTFMTVVQAYAEATGAPPDHTIARDLAGKLPQLSPKDHTDLLAHVDAVYSTQIAGIDYVGKRVEELGRKRAIRAAVVRIAELNERNQTPDEADAVTDIVADVMAAALALGTKDPNPVYSFMADYMQLPQWQAQFTSGSVRTMLAPLDDALQGGLMVGELGVVLAPPHRGKTLTLVNFAAGGLVAGANVLYVTTEDGVRGIGPRIAANLSGIPREEFGANWPRVLTALGSITAYLRADVRMVYRPPRTTGVPELRSLLDRLSAEGWRPNLLILDYADRLKAPRKRKDRWDELVDLYMDLRTLADEKQVAIWTASQTGKGGFGKEVVDMDDFAGAFQKAGEADVVLAFSQTVDEKAAGEARLHLTKARNRGSGKMIHVYADTARSLLREVPVADIPKLVSTQRKTGNRKNAAASTPPLAQPVPGVTP